MNRAAFLDLVRRDGLAQWPDLDARHASGIAESMRYLNGLRGSVIVDHPCVDGLCMDLDASVGAKIFHLLRIGDYEAGDFDLYRAHLSRGERVLELGGGVGVAAACCAQITETEVTVVEPNPRLHDLIRRQAAANGVRVRVDPRCATTSTTPPRVPFHLNAELWRSSLLPDVGEVYDAIMVDAVSVHALLDTHQPDVLIVDIEGSERELFEDPPQRIPRKLFVEIHVPRIGETASADLVERLTGLGYRLVDHRAWMFHFQAVPRST